MAMISPSYQQQLLNKQNYLTELLADYAVPELAVFASEPEHYRMRAEFRFWREDDDCWYAMFEKNAGNSARKVIKLKTLPLAHQHITELMPVLLEHIQKNPVLESRLYQIEFLTTLTHDTLITLIYHRQLDDDWAEAARQLATVLGVQIIGRSRKQKWVLDRDYVLEKLCVHHEVFQYKQLEGGFTQPNARMCEKMLNWATDVAQAIGKGDLLELYCGNGNFTLPLSRHFDRVLATEVSKTSVQAARWNIDANQINNIAIARLSAEEFTQAYHGVRSFRRLDEAEIDLADYHFSTVFVDPPRAGIDLDTLKLLQQFDNIIYVSCNPVTLQQNLAVLNHSHAIKRAALFDQFPGTPHIESGVWLQRR
ncbi:tRNA (uridine(54)-C5)-methyltransferase TrmA [Neisseriaceae bacterium ESL0693]|nr:tRNA (uridine(54)-C5)-methyltransferase TrmA [Neisseriaceae bacterium ESL0693]